MLSFALRSYAYTRQRTFVFHLGEYSDKGDTVNIRAIHSVSHTTQHNRDTAILLVHLQHTGIQSKT